MLYPLSLLLLLIATSYVSAIPVPSNIDLIVPPDQAPLNDVLELGGTAHGEGLVFGIQLFMEMAYQKPNSKELVYLPRPSKPSCNIKKGDENRIIIYLNMTEVGNWTVYWNVRWTYFDKGDGPAGQKCPDLDGDRQFSFKKTFTVVNSTAKPENLEGDVVTTTLPDAPTGTAQSTRASNPSSLWKTLASLIAFGDTFLLLVLECY